MSIICRPVLVTKILSGGVAVVHLGRMNSQRSFQCRHTTTTQECFEVIQPRGTRLYSADSSLSNCLQQHIDRSFSSSLLLPFTDRRFLIASSSSLIISIIISSLVLFPPWLSRFVNPSLSPSLPHSVHPSIHSPCLSYCPNLFISSSLPTASLSSFYL